MTADAFLHQMERFEQDIVEHPAMLKEFAAQTLLLNGLDTLHRDLERLARTLSRKP